jgi:hypothetical protein
MLKILFSRMRASETIARMDKLHNWVKLQLQILTRLASAFCVTQQAVIKDANTLRLRLRDMDIVTRTAQESCQADITLLVFGGCLLYLGKTDC